MTRLSLLVMIVGLLTLLALHLTLAGCGPRRSAEPPVARIEPHRLELHGDVRIDNYYWLRKRENPEVIAYLAAENEYTTAVMKHTEPLQERLFEEIKNRIKQDDESVPYKQDGYYYYQRHEDGKQYPIYCRKQGSLDAPEQVLVDANVLAEGHGFCSVRGRAVSSEENIYAYGVDTVGRRFYTLHFKNLDTGELYDDQIPDVTGNVVWANDNRTIFYSKQDPVTLRPWRVYRHVLGADPARDVLVFEEPDDTYRCYVFKTKSKRYVMIGLYQTLSNEFWYLPADDPESEFTVILPREREHEFRVDHYGNFFYIRTNWQAKNFRLMRTPVSATGKENWREVVPHQQDVYLQGFEIFKDHLVLRERKGGLNQIRIKPWSGEGAHHLDFGEPTYMAYIGENHDFDTPLVRYVYSSLTTPESTYDYNMKTREKTLLKRKEVLGGFDPANYRTERLHAPAADGTLVPISIVYREGFTKDGEHPLLLYAYGSYGSSMDAEFYAAGVSLLDRGFAYGIAHVRGGQELGRDWYEGGKLLNKKNTFTDFIACGEYLIAEGYTGADRLFAWGGSAGGLLVGAVNNLAPDLFGGIIAQVPWVDVITTMLDPSIPLTTSEYDEWGDPNVKKYYDYMLSYSPYDNVEAKAYPNLLVLTGLHDSQVQYWEPAKWVAKLRALKTDQNRLLLKTNLEAGHGGASGRYERYRETAFLFAFMLDLVDIRK